MTYFTPTLLEELASSGFQLDEFFRKQLETAINQLLANELTAFLGYTSNSYDGHHTGNSRNGYYERQLAPAYTATFLDAT